MKAQATYLVAYDIRNPRRLGRIYRLCKRAGLHLQYSVFLLRASPLKMNQFIRELESLIEPRRDDVRIYPVPERAEWTFLGRALWPAEVYFFHEGLDLLPIPLASPTVDGSGTACRPTPSGIDFMKQEFSLNHPDNHLTSYT
jgi:CRISPR-associated protein Cas2